MRWSPRSAMRRTSAPRRKVSIPIVGCPNKDGIRIGPSSASVDHACFDRARDWFWLQGKPFRRLSMCRGGNATMTHPRLNEVKRGLRFRAETPVSRASQHGARFLSVRCKIFWRATMTSGVFPFFPCGYLKNPLTPIKSHAIPLLPIHLGSARGRAPATSRAVARLTATGVTTSEGLRGGVRAQASLSSLPREKVLAVLDG